MKRKRLLVDVDEVLGDFQTPVFDILHTLFNKRLTPWDYDSWDIFETFSDNERAAVFAEMEKPGFCRNIQPTLGSIDAIKELRQHVDVYPVTSPFHSQAWVSERNEWLAEHFGFAKREVVHTGSKFLVSGDAILDDNPLHVKSWLEEHPNGLGMLWHIPNTRNLTQYDPMRVHSWSEVINKVLGL